MSVLKSQIEILHDGANEARKVNIHRLAKLLDAVAYAGQLRYDGTDPVEIAITIDELVEAGARVAGDLCRRDTTAA